jgi:tetratricopeptide (TPR) repeat protein
MCKPVFILCLGLAFSATLLGQKTVSTDSTGRERELLLIDAAKQKLTGNRDKAASLYEKVLSLDPGNAVAAYELSRLVIETPDFEKALRFARQAVAADPRNTWYQRQVAEVHIAMGRFADAAAVYEKLSALFPAEKLYYAEWAGLLEKAGQYPAALKAYDALEAQFGIQQPTSAARAALYMAMGDAKKAAREWERLCEQFPKNTAYLHLLADFYAKNNDLALAEQVWRRILRLDAQDTRALAFLADKSPGTDPLAGLSELVANRSVEPALKIEKLQPLLAAPDMKPNSAKAAQVLPLLTALEAAHPESAAACALLAQGLLLNGRAEEAAVKLLRSVTLDETIYANWEQLLALYQTLGDGPALARQASNALDIFPNKPRLYAFQALAAYWKGGYPEAQRDLSQALLIAGASDAGLRAELLSLQGLVWAALGDATEANKAFEQAAVAKKDYPLSLGRQALSLALQNQPEPAVALAQQVLRDNPGLPEARQALAWAKYRLGQFPEARQLLEALPYAGNPQILEQLGDVCFKSGLHGEAVQYWEKAKSKGGKSPQLLKKITDKQLYE